MPDDDPWGKHEKHDKPRPGKAFRHGVVTTTEPLAAQAGAEVLDDGGNAIDAAITTMFMLNVVEPQSSGIGGGGFMMIHLADCNETYVLNCRELSPEAMTPDVFASQGNSLLRTSSGYAVGVPGTLACAAAALEKWGTISLAEALAPAIEAADDGIVVSSRLATDSNLAKLLNETDVSSPVKQHYDVARSVFRPNGAPLVAGQVLEQDDLADTFRLIAKYGPKAFYRCGHKAKIADAIIATQLVTRKDNPQGVGMMTCDDLESYEVEIQAPITRPYRGYDIVTVPPPSSGGIALLQELAMLEQFPIGKAKAGFGFGKPDTINVMLEAMRLAFADRALWVGDETCDTCFDVPVIGLLSDAYLDPRANMIDVGQRLLNIQAGDPRPYEPGGSDDGVPFSSEPELSPGDLAGDTTHASIVDGDGNFVTFTVSIEATWGTGLMVPGYGFMLNNQLTDFNAEPAFNPDPLAFNPGANDPGPRKRPRSSMAPTMIFLDGDPVAAYGSPGGAQIINVLLNFTLNLIDHRLTLQESVIAPRISVTGAGNTTSVQHEDQLQGGGFAASALAALTALGVAPIGAVQAVMQIPKSGKQYGSADARRIGGVFGP